tara:strand:+ start:3320 stop:3619 length:300 start_codon:yes stop_codon:yes gene_type:complete
MKTNKSLSIYNRIAILRGYSQAVTSFYSERFGTMLELKTSESHSTFFKLGDVRSITHCDWDDSRIYGQRFAIVTLTDGEQIETGATVGEINYAIRNRGY